MMMRGLWKLTWIEIKVFLRERLAHSARSEFLSCSSLCWAARPTSGLRRLPSLRVALTRPAFPFLCRS